MKYLAGALIAIVLEAVIGLGLLYTGWYDPSATSGHTAVGKWLFETGFDHGVRAHAPSQPDRVAPELQRVADGAHEFSEHCAGCHGAPGHKPEGMSQAMLPQPPDLEDSAKEFDAAQLRWIIEHGVKMTGMPAWGHVLEPKEIAGLVAFVQQLPHITAADYRRMTAGSGKPDKDGDQS